MFHPRWGPCEIGTFSWLAILHTSITLLVGFIFIVYRQTVHESVAMAEVANGGGDEMDTEQDNPLGGVTYLCGGQF